jgi:hypothetical protein
MSSRRGDQVVANSVPNTQPNSLTFGSVGWLLGAVSCAPRCALRIASGRESLPASQIFRKTIMFDPVDSLGRLAVLVPRPRIDLLLILGRAPRALGSQSGKSLSTS